MPQSARAEFDRLLTAPLKTINTHKREIEALQKMVSDDPLAFDVARTTMALLGRVERKTSPLYVRLIHAVAIYVNEGETSWALRKDVVSAVAHSTKNFDLVMR